MITVKRQNSTDPFIFDVTVEEGDSRTRHTVTMAEATYLKLTNRKVSADHCIELAFNYLLEREQKEAILSNFDITLISSYFPDFVTEFKSYLRNSSA